MDIVNIADLAGFLFLGFGLLDGYRKGLVKKGASLLFTVGSLFLVYLISPYVENFLRQILPSFLNLDNISVDNDLYRLVMLSGFQDQAQLNEIVQMVGMDALSAPDRLKMEAARSIREDFLHQNSFHEVDTYTSLKKQLLMMRLVLAYYDKSVEALGNGAGVQDLIKLPVREQIGRYKYTLEENLDAEYQKVLDTLDTQIADVCGKEDF